MIMQHFDFEEKITTYLDKKIDSMSNQEKLKKLFEILEGFYFFKILCSDHIDDDVESDIILKIQDIVRFEMTELEICEFVHENKQYKDIFNDFIQSEKFTFVAGKYKI